MWRSPTNLQVMGGVTIKTDQIKIMKYLYLGLKKLFMIYYILLQQEMGNLEVTVWGEMFGHIRPFWHKTLDRKTELGEDTEIFYEGAHTFE